MTTTLQPINASASPEVQTNENFVAVAIAALFAYDAPSTSGLDFAYYGGIIGAGAGTFSAIADGSVTLTDDATNYIESTLAGIISANTSGWTAGRNPLYIATTANGAITAITDYRIALPAFDTGPDQFSTITIATGTITDSNPAISSTQTWNNAGVAFVGADMNITDTASDAASILQRWRVGGTEKASISKAGALTLAAGLICSTVAASSHIAQASGTKHYFDGVAMTGDTYITESSANILDFYVGGGKAISVSVGNIVFSANFTASADSTDVSFDFRRSNSSGIISSGNSLGEFRFFGHDGVAYRTAASIVAWVDGPPGASDMPGRLVFYTTPDGSITTTERLRIDNAGDIYGTAGTTGMTGGFINIPSAAGAPTGTPTAHSGRIPLYYDTTNNFLYVYNGGWKKSTVYA